MAYAGQGGTSPPRLAQTVVRRALAAMMRSMDMRLPSLLLVALSMVAACSDASGTPAKTTPDPDAGIKAPVLDDVTPDKTAPSDAAKPLPLPTPPTTGPAVEVTTRIGELGRLLGTIIDRKTAAAAKTRMDELIAEFGNLKVGHPDLGIPANVHKTIERLIDNREVEPVLGESLRQLQLTLQ